MCPVTTTGCAPICWKPALRVGPKFMYVLPNFQNPGGTTLPLERRLELVRLSNKYGIPIVEDDPYGALRFEGEHLPPLVALDSDFQTNRGLNGHGYMEGNVIYLGTFSKTLAPGLRLGWVVAPVEVIDQLVMAKQGTDLHTSGLRPDVGLRSGQRWFHGRAHPRHPPGLWRAPRRHAGGAGTLLPGGLLVDAARGRAVPVGACAGVDRHGRVAEGGRGAKVAYVPGFAFYVKPADGRNTMRLNFSNAQPEKIEEGIRRLGDLLKAKVVAKQPLAAALA